MGGSLSWVWILAGALLGVAGLTLLVLGVLGRRARGTRCCRACGYDLGPGSSLRCPECGRTHASEHDLRPRRRRRWGRAVAGILLLTAAALCLFAQRPLTRAFFAVMPTWRQVQRVQLDTCDVRFYEPWDPEQFGRRVRILHRGREVAAIEDFRLSAFVHDGGDLLLDVTNDGVPDLVLEGYSGGAHCCWTYTVVQLGDAPRVLAAIDAPNGGRFERCEPTGEMVYRSVDHTWNYWHAAYVDSARPAIVLRWQGGAFRLAPDLMRTPAPDDARIAALIALNRAEKNVHDAVPEPRFGPTVRLLYEGHPAIAWRVFDEGSPDVAPEARAAFRAELVKNLRASPYWPDLAPLVGERE